MLQLRQLNLEFAFPRAGALGKDIKNQRRAIQDLAVEELLEVSALGGSEFIIKNDRVHIRHPAALREIVGFASSNERGGTRRSQFLNAVPHNLPTGSLGKFG